MFVEYVTNMPKTPDRPDQPIASIKPIYPSADVPAGAITPGRSRNGMDYQAVPRVVTAMAKDEDYGAGIAPHSHPRAQLLYASEGVMRVSTDIGVWLIPPQRALLIAPGIVHELSMLSKVSLRTVFIEAAAAQSFGAGCRAAASIWRH
jgi:mannose-6-phosphate isomerase-like protein (cupin superfamily)